MKGNNLNENRAESLVFVHYNLRLLSHYCERAKSDKTYLTWDKNPEENNLDDGAMVLERLEAELLGDDDGDHVTTVTTEMPTPPSSSVRPIQPVPVFPPASQPPSSRGDRVAIGRDSRPLPPTPNKEARSAHKS